MWAGVSPALGADVAAAGGRAVRLDAPDRTSAHLHSARRTALTPTCTVASKQTTARAGLAPPTSAPGPGAPSATSAPRLGSPLPRPGPRPPTHICTGTGGESRGVRKWCMRSWRWRVDGVLNGACSGYSKGCRAQLAPADGREPRDEAARPIGFPRAVRRAVQASLVHHVARALPRPPARPSQPRLEVPRARASQSARWSARVAGGRTPASRCFA